MPVKLRGRLRVEMTDNPDTPVMVYVQSRGKHVASGTYHCVLDNGFDEVELTDGERVWLDSLDVEATAHYDKYKETEK